MQSRIYMVAVSLPCRASHCRAAVGVPCNYVRKGRLHRVRYNDAHRCLSDLAKMKDWERRYGGKSA